MIKSSSIVLLFCLMLGISRADDGHVILVSKPVKTTIDYHSGHSAVWTAKVAASSHNTQAKIDYTVEITRPPGVNEEAPYSLYNLRLQGRMWDVKIHNPPPGLSFFTEKTEKGKKSRAGVKPAEVVVTIDPAADDVSGNSGVSGKNVVFFSWPRSLGDKLTLKVTSDRKLKGKYVDKSITDHHSEPPPGTPGGEEGEPR